MHWSSSFAYNAVILISSPRKGELNVGGRLAEDLEQLRVAVHDFHFEHHHVKSRQELVEVLREVARQAKKGLRPIIHFDMHGDQNKGLEINPSMEFAGWPELIAWLRRINIRTRNNLCVVATACYGLFLIKPISIHNAVPFYTLIAPDHEVNLGFIDDKIPKFYRRLIEEENLDSAFEEISNEFKRFHSEKMLAIVLTKYIKQQCKGVGFATRREMLITEALARGIPRTKESLKTLRKLVKANIKPSEFLIKKYASNFLVGKEFPITLDQIVAFIETGHV